MWSKTMANMIKFPNKYVPMITYFEEIWFSNWSHYFVANLLNLLRLMSLYGNSGIENA